MSKFPEPLYPWTDWLDGKLHVLERGTHFVVDDEHFRTAVHHAAMRRGHDVTTRRIGPYFLVYAHGFRASEVER